MLDKSNFFKSISIVIILLVLAWIAYFHREETAVLTETKSQAKVIVVESSKDDKNLKTKENDLTIKQDVSVISVPPIQKNNNRFAVKPKDMMVQFEVIDGLAIAYGDTVLGKPSPDFSEKMGITELKPPRYWEHGIIPYQIKDDVINPERIKNTLDYFNQNTNVRFVPYENQSDAILFVRGEKNCASFLGKVGGIQPVYLSEKCNQPEISHELLHALGFIHEQSRVDRDQFINILWDNIDEKFYSQYAMVPEPLMEPYFDSPFDQNSIMMYESHMFSIRPELETMNLKNGVSLGVALRKLSSSDIERINRLYPK